MIRTLTPLLALLALAGCAGAGSTDLATVWSDAGTAAQLLQALPPLLMLFGL